MGEIIVARAPTGPAKALIILSVIIVVGRAWGAPWQVSLLLYAFVGTVAYVFWKRFDNMKLSVTTQSVLVVNFSKRFALDLASVRIDDEVAPDVWPQDDFIDSGSISSNTAGSKKARALCLTDASGIKVPVGVAPSYGTRLDEIAEDLYIAIDRMREAGEN